MRFKKEYFNAITKKIKKYNCIRFDSDIEFYVTNCTENQEQAAIKKAVEKFIEELKKAENMSILVDSLEMMLNCNEFDEKCTFNEIRNGGNAYEIEINRYDEKTLSIYIRICEHGDDITQEEIDRVFEEEVVNEFEQEQAEKKLYEEFGRAFINEIESAYEYFKRCINGYSEFKRDGQTRFETDINGDFWGCYECWFLLHYINGRVKGQGIDSYYELEGHLQNLAECFEEIKNKFEHGDNRTMSEIIKEYVFY